MSRKMMAKPTATTFVPVLLLTFCCIGFVYFAFFSQPSTTTGAAQAAGKDSVTTFLAFVAAITSLWNAYISHQYSVRLEEFKQQLSSKIPALKESREAALQYYRTLAKMESQNLTEEEINRSEEVMAQAEGSIYFLDEDYREAWYGFWQIADNVSKTFKKLNKSEAQKKWRSEWAKEIGLKLREFSTYQA